MTSNPRMPGRFYVCLVQLQPYPANYIFFDDGDYIIGCHEVSLNGRVHHVRLPLGPPPATSKSSGETCRFVFLKIRDQRASVQQLPCSKTCATRSCHFVFERFGRTAETLESPIVPENCTFHLLAKPNGGVSCTFLFRRILLGDLTQVLDHRSDRNLSGPSSEYFISVNERFEIFRDNRIGKGGNGEVFLGIQRSNGQVVAVKRERKGLLDHEFNLLRTIRLEPDSLFLRYLVKAPHPSVFLSLLAHSVAVEVGHSAVSEAITYYSARPDNYDHLILELIPGGELRKQLKYAYSSGMPLEKARVYIYQVVCGLVLIHSKHIVHRDLKCQNLLIRHGDSFESDEIKIIDFGNSAIIHPTTVLLKNYTTCFACAPEQFKVPPQGYSYPIDVWAVGTVFYELLTGSRLFQCQNMMEAAKMIPTFDVKTINERIPGLRQDALDFLGSCLCKDPQKRPTPFQLLTSAFLFPLHLYQIQRRIEATDVYNTYTDAFNTGYGHLTPLQKFSATDCYSYDKENRTFRSTQKDADVNVVLPLFDCVPEFRSQDHAVQIRDWIIDTDASVIQITSPDPAKHSHKIEKKPIEDDGIHNVQTAASSRNESVCSSSSIRSWDDFSEC